MPDSENADTLGLSVLMGNKASQGQLHENRCHPSSHLVRLTLAKIAFDPGEAVCAER